MRTKSFLTAGALAMLMAACSNEEVVNNEQLAMNRPMAGDVVLAPVFGGDAESRAIWTGTKHVFSEESDRFGVMLMDEWDASTTGFGAYTLVDYIHTNYPFKSEDGGYTWKSVAGAPLCEGNYFFTFPFNDKMSTRGMIDFSVPAIQTNVTAEGTVDALEAVNQYQKYLGYAFIEAGDNDVNEVTPNFNFIFANPKFKIKNSTGSSLKVFKLLIRATENGQSPELLPTKVRLTPGSGKFDAAAYLAADGDRKLELAELQDALTWLDGGDSNEGVYEYVIDCGDNYIVPTGEYIRLSAVIPGGFYPQLDVFAFVEEQNGSHDRGIIRLNETNHPNWDGQSQSGSMQNHMKPGITQLYTATVYPQSVGNLGVEGFTVVNSADMAFVLDLKAKNGGFEMLKITTWGEQVVLTEDIYNLLANENRKGIKVFVDGTIVIPAGAPADAIDQLSTDAEFATTTIINKGNQVLGKSTYECEIINEGTITEATDNNATIYGAVTVKEGSINVNNIVGDVEVKEGAELTVTAINGNVENDGTADIETVVGSIDNNGALTINNVTVRLTNNGTVTAETGSLNKVYNQNNGEITVVGAVSVVDVQNSAAIIVNQGAELKNGSVNNTGIITNLGTIKSTLGNYKYGTINNGVASRNVNEPFILNIEQNYSVVNVYAGKIANIYNESEGELHVWSADVDVTNAEGSKGTTIFEGVDAQHVGKYVNTVDKCSAELRVYRAYADKLASELKEILSLTKFEEVWTSYDIYFDVEVTVCDKSWNKIKVESGNVSFTANNETINKIKGFTDLYKLNFEVMNGAVLNIVDNSNFGINKLINNGEVHIASVSGLATGVTKDGMGTEFYYGHQILK